MCLIGSEAANTRGEVAAFLELVFGISSLSLATVYLHPSIQPFFLPALTILLCFRPPTNAPTRPSVIHPPPSWYSSPPGGPAPSCLPSALTFMSWVPFKDRVSVRSPVWPRPETRAPPPPWPAISGGYRCPLPLHLGPELWVLES